MVDPAPEQNRQAHGSGPARGDASDDRLSRTWYVVIGIMLIVAGVAAFVLPVLSTFVTTAFLAWLLVFAGVGQIAHAIATRRSSAAVWGGLTGLAWLAGGVLALAYPLIGTLTFTVVLAAAFVIQGVVNLFSLRGRPSTAWQIVSGVIAIAAGVLIWLGLPSTAAWALGVLVGANFIVTGVSYFAQGAVFER